MILSQPVDADELEGRSPEKLREMILELDERDAEAAVEEAGI